MTAISIPDFADFIINEVVEESKDITQAEAVNDILNDAERFISRLVRTSNLSRFDARRVVEYIRTNKEKYQ